VTSAEKYKTLNREKRSEECEDMKYQKVKEKLKKEYTIRLRLILKSQLNAKNKITEIEELGVQVLEIQF
jgi:hypothetical protein